MNMKRMIVLVMTLAMTLTLCACGAKSLVGSYDDGYDYYVFNKDKTYAYYARDLFGEGYNLLRSGTYTQDGEILRLYPDGLSVIMEYTVAWDNGKLVLYLGGNPMAGTVYDKGSDKCIPPEDLSTAGNIFSDASDTF